MSNSAQTLRDLMQKPHLSIEDEENNTSTPSRRSYTFLTLLSLLVLAIVIGTTLFLYIQNTTTHKNEVNNDDSNNELSLPTLPKCNNTKVYTDITAALKDADKVCSLDLSNQKLTKLPEGISQLTHLTALYLANNNISELSAEVFTLKYLVRLDAPGNQITSIPKEISNLKYLEILNLNNNKIVELPAQIGQLQSLQELDLSNNRQITLTSVDTIKSIKTLHALPDEIGEIKRLAKLDLTNNDINKTDQEKILSQVKKEGVVQFEVKSTMESVPSATSSSNGNNK